MIFFRKIYQEIERLQKQMFFLFLISAVYLRYKTFKQICRYQHCFIFHCEFSVQEFLGLLCTAWQNVWQVDGLWYVTLPKTRGRSVGRLGAKSWCFASSVILEIEEKHACIFRTIFIVSCILFPPQPFYCETVLVKYTVC